MAWIVVSHHKIPGVVIKLEDINLFSPLLVVYFKLGYCVYALGYLKGFLFNYK